MFSDKVIQVLNQLYVADERAGDLLKIMHQITPKVENVRRQRLNANILSARDLAS